MTYTRVALDGQEIIPYQELLGNYDPRNAFLPSAAIIPYQELLGNYDALPKHRAMRFDYTIPRAIREL